VEWGVAYPRFGHKDFYIPVALDRIVGRGHHAGAVLHILPIPPTHGSQQQRFEVALLVQKLLINSLLHTVKPQHHMKRPHSSNDMKFFFAQNFSFALSYTARFCEQVAHNTLCCSVTRWVLH
jgi:hypothetical protein